MQENFEMHSNWFNALKTIYVLFFIFLINTKCKALDGDASHNEVDESFQVLVPEYETLAKRAWNQLQGSWGKRTISGASNEVKTDLNDDYLDMLKSADYDVSRPRDYNLISASSENDDQQAFEKRAWKAMNGAWGKRNWAKFRSTGKREPGNWNNLRGLWGKRSSSGSQREPRSWNKLSSAWGK